jgi:precorrin-8X/cobalt-precorrin-8 methylmutase
LSLFSDQNDGLLYALVGNALFICIVLVTDSAEQTVKLGCEIHCFMSDPDVAQTAKERGCTRAIASMEKAAKLGKPVIFVVGNAPTALLALRELIDAGTVKPELVIGVPVGFVNILESKDAIMEAGVPYIVAKGRKGGSNVAAAIVNALMYQITR